MAAAQVPLIACASDCQDVLVSAGADHSCHAEPHAAPSHAHPAGHHACRHHRHATDHHTPAPKATSALHAHGALSPLGLGEDHHDQDEGDDHPEGVHELIQIAVVSAGFPCELPPHSLSATTVDLDGPDATLLSSIQIALEAAHQAEPDPVPVPLPASVALLL